MLFGTWLTTLVVFVVTISSCSEEAFTTASGLIAHKTKTNIDFCKVGILAKGLLWADPVNSALCESCENRV